MVEISKKTRLDFQEFLVSKTLAEIQRYFESYELSPVEVADELLPVGQRRSLVTKYYAGVDWSDPKEIRKILGVYSDILTDFLETDNYPDLETKERWTKTLFRSLGRDGFEFKDGRISRIGEVVSFVDLDGSSSILDKGHFQEYLSRIDRSIDSDPGLAIGSTKELLESTLRTILKELHVECGKSEDIPQLLKKVQKELNLVPDDVDEAKKGNEIIKTLLSNLGQVVIKIAELRNLYGTGHGKEKKRVGLTDRHARLASGSGITLSKFLLETFELRRTK